MKIIGTGSYDANITTTTNSLAAAIMTRPEIAAHVSNFWQSNYTAFSSLLARKNMLKGGLEANLSEKDFKVIGNKKFQWMVEGLPFDKCVITKASIPAVGFTDFGTDGAAFKIYLNANYYSPNDRLGLNDGETQVQVMDIDPLQVTDDQWEYVVKLATNQAGDSIPAASEMLALNAEVGFAFTSFPEMSETGYEKNSFPEWRTEYMTIQRMQYSISGSAANTKVYWAEHNGEEVWFTRQEMKMMERWAIARENQILFGIPTINEKDEVFLKDMKGREIISGSGVVNQGEPSLRYNYNKLTIKHVENIMKNMQLLSNGGGEIEIAVQGGQTFVWEFAEIMLERYKLAPQVLFTNDGGDRGVNANFNVYMMGNVKLIVSHNKGLDAEWRATTKDNRGNSKRSKDAYFFALNTTMEKSNIELVTLGNGTGDRSFVKRIIDGMESPGEDKKYASNSVDGFQVQILSESGVKLDNEFGIGQLRCR
jgi:hypothetical protein